MGIFVKAYKNLVYQSRKTNLKIEIAFYHLLFIISCIPLKTWLDLLTAIPKTPTLTYALVNTIAIFSLPIIIPTATLIGSWSLIYYLQEIMKLSKEKNTTTIFVTICFVLDLISIAIAIQYSIIPIALSFWIIQGLFIIALFALKFEK